MLNNTQLNLLDYINSHGPVTLNILKAYQSDRVRTILNTLEQQGLIHHKGLYYYITIPGKIYLDKSKLIKTKGHNP